MPQFYIVSDLHLGSRHFELEQFERFLSTILPDSTLVVNGDLLDRPSRGLPSAHMNIMDWLRNPPDGIETRFVEGNHDPAAELAAWGLTAHAKLALPEVGLLVTHGASFDSFAVGHKFFVKAFRIFHNIRVGLGASPVHVARYAKQWSTLYRVMCRNVRREAVACAKADGFSVVACGHVHSAEDVAEDGVRYINTGSWTEPDTMHYLMLDAPLVELRRWEVS